MELIIQSDADAYLQILEASERAGVSIYERYRGCRPRESVCGSIPGIALSFTRFPRIPRSEWKDRIIAGKGTWLSDVRKGKLEPHDQGRSSLCWMHGSVRAMEVLRVYQGQTPILLSAECAATQVTGGRNRGGMPDEALQHLRTIGTCDQSMWPKLSLSSRNADPGWIKDQKNHVTLDWVDVANFDDQMTCAFHRVPVAIGLRWWRHLVCQLDPVIMPDGSFGIGIDNSWGPEWGENGYGTLSEKYGEADLGAFAPISETFSET